MVRQIGKASDLLVDLTKLQHPDKVYIDNQYENPNEQYCKVPFLVYKRI